jgi:hypothetical protein
MRQVLVYLHLESYKYGVFRSFSDSTADNMQKYEEYTIPAGKVGILGKGRKLVNISEMDGLCRRTFKGYKSLNRMQSLVYPVAYQTSENMLICAPTGAVCQLSQNIFDSQ